MDFLFPFPKCYNRFRKGFLSQLVDKRLLEVNKQVRLYFRQKCAMHDVKIRIYYSSLNPFNGVCTHVTYDITRIFNHHAIAGNTVFFFG